MDRIARSALGSFERVQQFLTQHPLSDVAESLGEQATELDDVIMRLSSKSVDQEAGGRFVGVHAKSQRNLRVALYASHMQPVSRIAREVFGFSGMDRAFRMPKTSVADKTLLAAAAAMAEAAEKENDVFRRHGLPQEFIEQLKAAATALGDARTAQNLSARRRVGATAAVKDQVKRGRKAVRLLNAILEPRLAQDPELWAKWRSAKRIPPATAAGVPEPADAALKVA